MRIYWMAFCNDGVELSGCERNTRAEAINDCKNAFRFDYDELGHDPSDTVDYYVEQFTETDDELICGAAYDVKMTLGKRGGVSCKTSRKAW